jgi:hypothetical protein
MPDFEDVAMTCTNLLIPTTHRRPRMGASALALIAGLALAVPVQGLSPYGLLDGLDLNAPCSESEWPLQWTPPNEEGTGPSELACASYHSFSFHVTEAGMYRVTTFGGPGYPEPDWSGLVALYGPPFDPTRPLQSLIAVDYFEVEAGEEVHGRLDASLLPGVVYRVVTSSIEEAGGFFPYTHNIEGPVGPGAGQGRTLFASACYPVGDEKLWHDDDMSGLAVQQDRFCVEADWITPQGESGVARAVPYRSDDSVLFWFFSPDNWELQVKVLDGCRENGHFWVSYSATTNVEFELRVFGRDRNIGLPPKTYHNEQGHRADAVIDTTAFPCEDVLPN